MERLRLTERLGQHWFYLLLPLWLAASINFHFAHSWQQQPHLGEAVALFDWCLFVPALYALYYRKSPARGAIAIRVLALMCGGIWMAGQMVPDPAETLLRDWAWLRAIGTVAVVLIEGVALVAAVRIAFSGTADPQALVDTGIPPLLARMMLAEARFWRWVLSRLRP